jgi:hypothetical protein
MGNQIAAHQRRFGKTKLAYKLERYLPLLEQHGYAIINTAPVRQNVPSYRLEQNIKSRS